MAEETVEESFRDVDCAVVLSIDVCACVIAVDASVTAAWAAASTVTVDVSLLGVGETWTVISSALADSDGAKVSHKSINNPIRASLKENFFKVGVSFVGLRSLTR